MFPEVFVSADEDILFLLNVEFHHFVIACHHLRVGVFGAPFLFLICKGILQFLDCACALLLEHLFQGTNEFRVGLLHHR